MLEAVQHIQFYMILWQSKSCNIRRIVALFEVSLIQGQINGINRCSLLCSFLFLDFPYVFQFENGQFPSHCTLSLLHSKATTFHISDVASLTTVASNALMARKETNMHCWRQSYICLWLGTSSLKSCKNSISLTKTRGKRVRQHKNISVLLHQISK